MKIAIMSDFHFGYNDDALVQAAEALRRARESADFVIAAGDLFDSRVPRPEIIHDAITILKDHERKTGSGGVEISELGGGGKKTLANSPLIAIYGTHERRTKGLVNAVQVLDSAGLVVNVHAKTALVEKNGEIVAVQGMGGVPEEHAAENLRLLDPRPVPGAFNIFVFHQSMKEIASVGEGMAATDLPGGFDLYVDGHIHWAQELKLEGKRVLLPGSTVVTQMKRTETEPKGFYLFDTATGAASFVKISSRPFFFSEIVLENASPSKVVEEARKKLSELAIQAGGRTPLVKLKLLGTLEKGIRPQDVDLAPLEREFGEKMALGIDKEFASEELAEKIGLLRKLREEKKSVREMGLSVLERKLFEAGVRLPSEELFELLADAKGGEKDEKIRRALEIV